MSAARRKINVLNVAEKPSVARSVATILSRNQNIRMREGRSRYNKIFEFEYTIQGQPCHMIFTSVTGHLMELDFDDRFRKWHSCDPAQLFHAPVCKFVPEDKKDIKRTLEEESRRCQRLVLWLDCDREGENIAFEVIEVCKEVNHHLDGGSIKRARFSALIDREIHRAMQNLEGPNKHFADAVDARQEIDLRIGASFTRFQTMLLKDKFVIDSAAEERNLVLSYGPCQFPTLGFIVERYWEIQSHEPEEFWTINCSHKSDEGTATFNWMRGRLFDYTSAVIIYEMCVQEPNAMVRKVQQQEKLKYPPYPLNTIELEKRASRYFRMSSEHTMKVAEELYQAGFISYPRTETDSFSSGTDLQRMVQEQQAHPAWGSYAQQLLDPAADLWRNPGSGGHDDKAHPPIHPTNLFTGGDRWSNDHSRLYELVVRHFLACVSKPAVGAETIVEIDIAGELFSASGRVILARNYLDVYRFESWGGSTIPTYEFGQQFIPTTLTLDSGVTRPPSLLTEADLLSCMDKAGIGTDATMHDHIKKLLDRCYATKDLHTRFSPTNLGEALVMGYDDIGTQDLQDFEAVSSSESCIQIERKNYEQVKRDFCTNFEGVFFASTFLFGFGEWAAAERMIINQYELWKPNLRSKMESDLRDVSYGYKGKEVVLASCLEETKACFLDVRMNKVKLMEAMTIFFERANRSTGDDQLGAGEVVRQCGQCQESDMVLKHNRDGNFMVGCLGFPQCRNAIWLPGPVLEATVTTTICTSCTPGPVHLIQFKFRQLEIPPGFSANHLGCIGGCDETLRQLIEICGTGSRTQARPQGPMASSGNFRQSNGREVTCLYCQQRGHTSSDCPSKVSGTRNTRSRVMNQQNGETAITCSSCRTPCVLRTANTANNRGRKFYSCPSQECNFFAWEDNVNNSSGAQGPSYANISNSASNPSRRSGRGRGGVNERRASDVTFVSATGEPQSGRRCFVCGDPSHFANVCPNRQQL